MDWQEALTGLTVDDEALALVVDSGFFSLDGALIANGYVRAACFCACTKRSKSAAGKGLLNR